MSLFGSLFGVGGGARKFDVSVTAALARWNATPVPALQASLAAQHWLVVDVETTGLDIGLDRLLAIGGVIVEGGRICFDQSFEAVIRQAAPSRSDNILIHRIPGSEQLEGVDGAVALAKLLDFSHKLPIVAFHAAFDVTMLKRAYQDHLGIDFTPRFIDLALLAPALFPDAPTSLRSLDDWVEHFAITISARHRAVADALGTAKLFQILLNRANAQHVESAGALFKLAREQRWLAAMNRHQAD